VHEEPPNKLVRVECHILVPVVPVDPVVLAAEGHAILVDRDQAAV
jgi:hypothetical protein